MENKNTLRNLLFVAIALVLVISAFGGGVAVGYFLPPRNAVQASELGVPTPDASAVDPSNTGSSPEIQSLFRPFWETWDIVHQQYVDQPVDDTKLMEGAIQGMLESLGDPHTGYMNPRATQDEQMIMSGEYEGIGAWVDTGNDYLTIVSPMTNSPAEKAGLQPGDKIIGVDGQDVTGIDPSEVRLKVLGPANSTVVLTIQREGVEQPFDLSVVRAQIIVPSVESKMLDNNIAYIKISLFGETTASDFQDQLQKLMEQNPQGLILDVRNNGGGLLDAAVSISSEFIDNGVILYEKYGDGTLRDFPAQSGGLAIKIPMVVLVNEGTASASEIVSGAIQDYSRGKLIGVTTYGKGSVQYWMPVSDGGTVRVTIAKWLTPNERTIDKIGLTPDIVVERTAEDYTAGLDPQLDAAMEVLLNP